MSDKTTYYNKNREMIPKRPKIYYENKKERFTEQARNKYRALSEKEKDIYIYIYIYIEREREREREREYGKNRYKNTSEKNKQRLKEYQKKYRRAKK